MCSWESSFRFPEWRWWAAIGRAESARSARTRLMPPVARCATARRRVAGRLRQHRVRHRHSPATPHDCGHALSALRRARFLRPHAARRQPYAYRVWQGMGQPPRHIGGRQVSPPATWRSSRAHARAFALGGCTRMRSRLGRRISSRLPACRTSALGSDSDTFNARRIFSSMVRTTSRVSTSVLAHSYSPGASPLTLRASVYRTPST